MEPLQKKDSNESLKVLNEKKKIANAFYEAELNAVNPNMIKERL